MDLAKRQTGITIGAPSPVTGLAKVALATLAIAVVAIGLLWMARPHDAGTSATSVAARVEAAPVSDRSLAAFRLSEKSIVAEAGDRAAAAFRLTEHVAGQTGGWTTTSFIASERAER